MILAFYIYALPALCVFFCCLSMSDHEDKTVDSEIGWCFFAAVIWPATVGVFAAQVFRKLNISFRGDIKRRNDKIKTVCPEKWKE